MRRLSNIIPSVTFNRKLPEQHQLKAAAFQQTNLKN